MRNIFFDLDGTLIDSRPRLYQLFSDLFPGTGFSFEDYWDLKRRQIGHEKIIADLNDPGNPTFEDFQKEWMQRIETKEYLALDIPFPGIKEMFSQLKQNGNSISIITSRQSPALVEWQIGQWGWQEYLTQILVTKQTTAKTELIKQHFPGLSAKDIMIGDTGKDIETARELGLISIAVLSGFLNKQSLLKYKPDYLFDLVTEIDFNKIN